MLSSSVVDIYFMKKKLLFLRFSRGEYTFKLIIIMKSTKYFSFGHFIDIICLLMKISNQIN